LPVNVNPGDADAASNAPPIPRVISQHVVVVAAATDDSIIAALAANPPSCEHDVEHVVEDEDDVVCTPCRCLCFGVFVHTTNNRPRRRTILHASHNFFIAVLTCVCGASPPSVVVYAHGDASS